MNGHLWVKIGAISGFLAVALGAFGAHGLRERFKVAEADSFAVRMDKQRTLENFDTAARYQMYHALAIVAVGILAASNRTGASDVAGWSFLVGTALFSGSLYVLVLTGQKWLGAITPFGGVGFLIGWLALAFAARNVSKF
ncbi:DUF423 domain-containing protein [Singulisphaera rosea]